MKKILVFLALLIALLPLMAVYHKLGDFASLNSPADVTVAGNISYMVERSFDADLDHWNSTLLIIDVSDPANPVQLSSYTAYGYALSVDIEGTHVYFGCSAFHYGRLNVIDVSDPQNPVLDCSFQCSGGFVTVEGNFAYLGGFAGFQIIDVSDPHNPTGLGFYDAIPYWGCINSIKVVNGIAYSTFELDGGSLMYIFNVANPQSITLMGSYPLYPNWANSITVTGSIAYIAEGINGVTESYRGLQIMDVSDPQNPSMICSFPTPGSANWVTVNGNTVYLADGESGLLAIDVSTPQNPVLVSSYDTPGEAASFSINGAVAYVADGGLQIIDISDPQNTNLLGGYDTPGESYSVQVAGNTAYLADGTAGMQIVDLSNPQNPFLISAYDTPGEARSITVVGNTAYIADSNSGVHVFDVYYPEFPILLGTCPIGASYITVAGNYAYVLDDSHMRIVDVSDVQDPDLMSSYYILGVNSITVNDGIACVANGDLQLVDVSNPLSPAMLGFYATPGYTEFVAVAGNFAYLADSGSGVQIIDISNPAAPTLLSTIPPHHTTSYVSRCQIRGNVLYISDKNWNEISTYDVSVPQTPVLLSRYPWNLSANDIWVDGDRLCTANGEYGLNIYDLDLVSIDDPIQMPPTAFQLRNYPNPFNPETTISYTLPAAGMVSLEIFNSRGQLIRSLLKEEQPAGEHSLIWNGKGDSSHSVASGLYLCRIASNGKQETRKLLLIK